MILIHIHVVQKMDRKIIYTHTRRQRERWREKEMERGRNDVRSSRDHPQVGELTGLSI